MTKSLYILAGYDEVTNQRLDQYKQMIEQAEFISQETKGLPHHITLGTYPVEDEIELKNKLDIVASQTKSFDITFNHMGIFEGAKVLFIAPDANHSLLTLKEYFGDSFNWTAHTTMLISEPKAIYSANELLGAHFKRFTGIVNSLYLYEFFPSRLIKKVKLK